MTDAVFDTTVFVDAYTLHPGATVLLRDARQGRLSASFSAISMYELWVGKSISRAEELFLASALAALTEIPLESQMGRQVALWLRELPRQQRLRLASDAMIAASTASVGATLYTRNPRDFTRFYTNVQSY